VHLVVVVVVVLRVVVVVVVVVVVPLAVVVVVVVVVVLVGGEDADCDEGAELLVVVVESAGREAGGIGSTAPNSAGSRLGASSVSVPRANSVQAIAPTRAPTASRPCPGCRVDPIGVLRVFQRPLVVDRGIYITRTGESRSDHGKGVVRSE
jgi:hypothetical protein